MAGRTAHLALAAAALGASALAEASGERRQGSCTTAMALQGGGFRAVAVDAGLIAGMLAVVGQDASTWPTLDGTGLLNRFCLLTTNSGSSWFTAELAYSNRFQSLIEGMAASPATAAAQYKASWTDLWLKATKVIPDQYDLKAQLARDIVRDLLGNGDEDTIFMVQYFLAAGFTWTDFTDLLLSSTGDLSSGVYMGSPVGKWATGKVWQAVHSAVLPTESPPGIFFEGDPLAIPKVSYHADSTYPVPIFLPASFSIELGAGLNATAPLRYIAPSAIENLTQLAYKADYTIFPLAGSAMSGALGSDLARGSLQNYAGRLPVVGIAAASSAFLGSACVMGAIVAEAEELLHGDLTPWVSDAPSGLAFSQGRALVNNFAKVFGVNPVALHELAGGGARAIIDGGFTDGTGIGQAVAAGATEVLAVLNSNASAAPFYIELLFKGGPMPTTLGQPAELYPLFQSPVASVLHQEVAAFPHLNLTSSMIQFMKVFSVGTIRATTAENRYFGIEAGRNVDIHIITVGSDLDIGPFDNLNNFDMLAQEIQLALLDPSNAGLVKGTLVPMFLGPSWQVVQPVVI